MSILVVNIILAVSLTKVLWSSPPVSDLPVASTLSISCFQILAGCWSMAVSWNNGLVALVLHSYAV